LNKQTKREKEKKRKKDQMNVAMLIEEKLVKRNEERETTRSGFTVRKVRTNIINKRKKKTKNDYDWEQNGAGTSREGKQRQTYQ
jgi:hypothetical protein